MSMRHISAVTLHFPDGSSEKVEGPGQVRKTLTTQKQVRGTAHVGCNMCGQQNYVPVWGVICTDPEHTHGNGGTSEHVDVDRERSVAYTSWSNSHVNPYIIDAHFHDA